MAEENSNDKFTILGETGSGKTCYLLGMYYEMTMGVAVTHWLQKILMMIKI